MKKVTAAIILTLLFGAEHALAQSYYPLINQGSCVSISRDLTIGSRGSDVLSLQKFILSRNYPGGGTWMLTSYYGAATFAGVKNVQMDMHLPQTGVVDSMTRNAISQATCGYSYGNVYHPSNSYQTYPWTIQSWTNYGTNYGNPSNSNCGWYTIAGRNYFNDCGIFNPNNTLYPNNGYPYNNYGGQNAPSISNVSGPTTLNVNTTGTWMVSINNQYNSNYSSISVDWGEPTYGAYMAAPQQVYGSQTATFTHAYSQSGTYTVRFTVSNSYGSNTSTITVQVNNTSSNIPNIVSISPTYGSVGTQIMIYGTGFSGDNTVHFGNGGKMHVTSASGNYIYFTVPSYLSPCDVQANGYCAQYLQNVTPGQYQIYVTSNGYNSNSLTFTVQ